MSTGSRLTLKAAGQAIAYYSRSKSAFTGSGVGILLSEHIGNVMFRIILFPFNNTECGIGDKAQFGSQALLLPEIEQSYDDFMKGDFVKLICAVSSSISDEEFKLQLPQDLELVLPLSVMGAFSSAELEIYTRIKRSGGKAESSGGTVGWPACECYIVLHSLLLHLHHHYRLVIL